jgi:uncharacterized protein YcbX
MADTHDIGRVEALFRYPVKSMAGEALATADIGWHGVDGDRRVAVCRVGELGGMPWLTASRLPALLTYVPVLPDVRTPDGLTLPIGDELADDIARRWGKPVRMVPFKNGIFDEGAISLITPATIDGIGAECGMALDVRRFRPNVLVRTDAPRIFEEDAWVGGVLSFGDDGPVVHVTLRDERCAMLNLDPDSAQSSPQIMKAVVRMNDNHAGVYATVVRRGTIAVGQRVRLTQ